MVEPVRAGTPARAHLTRSSSLFAAIGPDSATLLGSCPHPAPVSVIHIQGTADRNIPYGGGRGDGSAHIDGPSVPSVVAMWRAVDGCPAPSTATAGPVTTATAACPDGRAVELDATATIWQFFAAHPKPVP